ncbi:MAG: hypothetical protein IJI61_06155 [Oscillospiraceae bacterium]|nr:hypothetical protein [Oscillospiraceae bacterium]
MQDRHACRIQLRKSEESLRTVGLCVIAFGIWSIIKTILLYTSALNSFLAEIPDSEFSENTLRAVFLFLQVFILAIDIGIRLYIARSSIDEGRGKKKRVGYIVLGFLIAAFNMLGMAAMAVITVSGGKMAEVSISNIIISLIVEISSISVMLEMCVSGIRVKKLRGMLAEQG